MKLNCHKCKKTLTESLVYIPLKVIDTKNCYACINHKSIFEEVGDEEYSQVKMRKGIFYISKNKPAFMSNWHEDYPGFIVSKQKPMIIVGKKSILAGVIPEFKQGYGCCDYSAGEPLLCGCGVKLGQMFLDCYEDEYIKFYPEKVDRSYKS